LLVARAAQGAAAADARVASEALWMEMIWRRAPAGNGTTAVAHAGPFEANPGVDMLARLTAVRERHFREARTEKIVSIPGSIVHSMHCC
jgi:hypothetical protein